MLKKLTLFCIIFIFISSMFAIYSEINVDFFYYEEIKNEGFDIAHINPHKGITIIANDEDYRRLDYLGVDYEIIHEDLETFYRERIDEANRMGAYRTYDEIITVLDSLYEIAPHIVSEKDSIGAGWLGNVTYTVKISDNVELDEDEPEVLIDGAIHAREVITPECILYYMFWLIDGYGRDSLATYIVDNREVYLIPVLNADGYIHNELINPGGGGMWRKNRRDNGDGTFGVDLNRNFPYMWGLDDYGSSPDTDDATYRGPFEASEPETQVFMDFVLTRNFRTHFNYHSYSNLFLTPWGYTTDILCPEHEQFMEMGAQFAKYNGYLYGNDVIYETNGGITDWVYAPTEEKPLIWSFAVEVGGGYDGFWPPPDRIEPLIQENLWPQIYLTLAAKGVPMLESFELIDETGDGSGHADPGEVIEILPTIRNRGTGPIEDVFIIIKPYMGVTEVFTDSIYIGHIDSFTSAIAERAFQLTIDSTLSFEDNAEVIICTRNSMGYYYNDTISFPIGTPIPVETFSLDEIVGDFSGDWQFGEPTTGPEAAYTGDNVWATLLDDNYNDNTLSMLELPEIELPAGFEALRFTFMHWYKTEADAETYYDGGNVKVTIDGGPFTLLEPVNGYDGPLASHSLLADEGSFSGVNMNWTKVEFDISDFAGHTVQFRLDFASDPYVNSAGWYVDDFAVEGYFSYDVEESKPIEMGLSIESYPNPFNSSCIIKSELAHKIEIFDISGKIIESVHSNSFRFTPKSDLESGIYFIRASNSNDEKSARIIYMK